MSSLVSPISPSRLRVPRTAGSAIERARLALVPTRRSQAPRAPFAVLVFLILGAGVVGLLMFNTHMQQASFYATSLQAKADRLAAKRQALEMELAGLRSPQALAVDGRKLGMVVPPNPAFLDLATGRVSGVPLAAGPSDKMPVNPPPAHLPPALNPGTHVVKVLGTKPASTTGTATATKTGAKTGAKTGTPTGKHGKNSGQSQAPHGPASP